MVHQRGKAGQEHKEETMEEGYLLVPWQAHYRLAFFIQCRITFGQGPPTSISNQDNFYTPKSYPQANMSQTIPQLSLPTQVTPDWSS